MTSRMFVGVDPSVETLCKAVDMMARGAIVAYPTDTLYALGVDPRHEDAVRRLCQLKGRAGGRGVTLVAADLRQVETCLGVLPPLGRRLAERFWPGSLTIVLEPESVLAESVHASDGTLAVRVPRSRVASQLAALAGHPITATSANRRGMVPAGTGGEVVAELGSTVALVLEVPGRLAGVASTIVDARGAHPVQLRAGAVPWDRVLQSLA